MFGAVTTALVLTATGVAIVTGSGTLARFSDTEAGGAAVAGSGTVVLGGRSTPVALDYPDLRSGISRTVTLSVDYRGSVPATIQLRLPSGAAPTQCQRSGTTWTDAPLAGSLTITLGTQPATAFCPLLDGTARTVLATVAPRTVTAVPITVRAGGLILAGRNERAAIVVRAVGGFSDQVAGTISISTGSLLGGRAVALSAPAPATVAAPVPPVPPAECTGRYTETVELTAARPRFVAAEDRPGAAGPFLVYGTAGDDLVTGSQAGDCLVGGSGFDILDGASGDDVLLGGDGPDRLTGGAGADLLDGGPDGGTCDADPADRVTSCTVPAPVPEPEPVVPDPVRPADPAPAPEPAPQEQGPAEEPAEPGQPEPEPAPEIAPAEPEPGAGAAEVAPPTG